MFIGNSKKLKKIVIYFFNFLCTLFLCVFTVIGVISKDIIIFMMFFGSAVLYTIAWILIYKFYVSKI